MQKDNLLRTNFVNKEFLVSNPFQQTKIENIKIGIHIHLYYAEQADLFVSRLSAWEIPFELYISVCSKNDQDVAYTKFNKKILLKMSNLIIKIVPNRGRDVAPWLIAFRTELINCDYVCHVHTKLSSHFPWGDEWRDYLLDNLITSEALNCILGYFKSSPKVGLIFPPMYKKIFKLWQIKRISHLGKIDRLNCIQLLNRMGISDSFTDQKCFFSVGTMFWYKRKALLPLFNLNLSYESFPEEPIEITGTFAHAIERLPSIVAAHQGYETLCYLKQSFLIDDYFNNLLTSARPTPLKEIRNTIKYQALYFFKPIVLYLFPPGSLRYKIVESFYMKYFKIEIK